ncbi:MAG: PecA family PE domain-processing aspartic protease [Mycobacterium sp.]
MAGRKGTVGVLVAAAAMAIGPLVTAPAAKADIIDDLLDPIIAPLITAMSESAAAVDPSGLDLGDLLSGSLPAVDVTTPLEPAAAVSVAAADSLTVPLTMYNTTEPLVNLSVAGGSPVTALVDTGSDGLVIPISDIGPQGLSWPTSFGVGGFSSGIDYVYATMDLPVSFETASGAASVGTAPVDVELFAFPASLQNLFNPVDWSWQSYFSGDDAAAVLGLGPNAVGPGPSFLNGLPDPLSQGVLIDEPDKYLEFGPDPLTTGGVTVDGAPNATLEVSVGDGPKQTVDALIDSGGVYGGIPSSVASNLPAGPISVYTSDGQLLYTYTTNPPVTSGDLMNTGYEPFSLYPVYISNADDTTTIFTGSS